MTKKFGGAFTLYIPELDAYAVTNERGEGIGWIKREKRIFTFSGSKTRFTRLSDAAVSLAAKAAGA